MSMFSQTIAFDHLVEDHRVHRSLYTDQQIFALEMNRVFGGTWTFLAHESELPNPNDFVRKKLGLRPVIVTRDRDGKVHGLLNRCTHRGATICRQDEGNSRRFTCPYHNWSFANSGELVGVPMEEGYGEGFDKSALGLGKLRVETYRGFVFGTFSDEIVDLEIHLGAAARLIDEWLDRWPGAKIQLRRGAHRLMCASNWKLIYDNAADGYHPGFSHASLSVGDIVASTLPSNQFQLVTGAHYIFIAGGIGITPLLTMAKYTTSQGKSWEFHYLGRSRSTMAFIPELSELAAAAGAALAIVARDEGRRATLADIFAKAGKESQVYCCGPSRLLDEVEVLAEGVLSGRLHVERFGRLTRGETVRSDRASMPPCGLDLETDCNDLLADRNGAFEVEFRKTGVTLEVGPGETILGCARKIRQGLSFSCSDGYCGTCETRVIAGLPDHRDSVLTDAEKVANRTMMICVGRSRSKRLVLDL